MSNEKKHEYVDLKKMQIRELLLFMLSIKKKKKSTWSFTKKIKRQKGLMRDKVKNWECWDESNKVRDSLKWL